MGDFNVNLLNYDRRNHTNDFVNTMNESVSGNIITHISDHFPQFIILNKVNVDYKKRDLCKMRLF